MKRISMFLVMAFVLTTVMASATNPFSDVPFSHWAYDAVNKLAAKDLIKGYPDGTFKGTKHVTRYDLAIVTAKMLASVEQMMEKGFGNNLVTKSDLQTLEKLTVEFADELALLGVKVTALEDDMQVVKEDVSTLKKDVEGIKDYMAKGGMEKVKLSGDMLVRHSSLIHNRDWNNVGGNIGNANNAQTQTQLRFQFKANIDENITAVARWHMLNKADSGLNTANNVTAWGAPNAMNDVSSNIDLAYLHIKDMFRFGGDFTFGRNFYATGHSLLFSNYADAIMYKKRSGDIDIGAITVYGRHQGNYNDQVQGVDFRNIWGLTFGGKYHDHDLYLNLFDQEEPNLYNGRFATGLVGGLMSAQTTGAAGVAPVTFPGLGLSNTAASLQKHDSLIDVEFGGKGPLGKNGHWDYDLGFAYSGYHMDRVQNATNNVQNITMDGWMGTMAVKWDSKKEWAAKLGYTFADDKSVGVLSLNNDHRYDDGVETPYEDISRGNTYFRNGLTNMYDLKVQVEYRPRNTKHYFRLAGDFLGEMKDQVSNDMTRALNGVNAGTPDLAAGQTSKNNTVYDQWNNFGTTDPTANVLTFEYRYQLAENTRIRVGYTAFDMTGTAVRGGYANGVANTLSSISAGRGTNGDYKYNTFWAELYSRF
ncbi:MAG: S-layer homology domain-containing protein [Candidatus Riflebacteria bacterium]|nr:S-layer homology domain-containing protein [Candidatus Riflebacteria bacterium]